MRHPSLTVPAPASDRFKVVRLALSAEELISSDCAFSSEDATPTSTIDVDVVPGTVSTVNVHCGALVRDLLEWQ